jgi:hypothetical protein
LVYVGGETWRARRMGPGDLAGMMQRKGWRDPGAAAQVRLEIGRYFRITGFTVAQDSFCGAFPIHRSSPPNQTISC